MISTKNCTKKQKQQQQQQKKRTGRTLGQMVKAKLYRQNHTKKHTHSHSQKEKKEKNIYCCSQNPLPQFWDVSLSIQIFQRCRVHQVDCGYLIHCS